MKVLLGREEMRKLDDFSINTMQIPSLALMESAGAAVAEEIIDAVDDIALVVVVCGPGNNGGDGMVLARRLGLMGYSVSVLLSADPGSYKGDAAIQLRAMQNLGITWDVLRGEEGLDALDALNSSAIADQMVLVDALFGTGLQRPVEGYLAQAISLMNVFPGTKVALDIPSGMNADTGAIDGACFRADLTVTFAPAKIGMLMAPAVAEAVGDLVEQDIGLSAMPLEDEQCQIARYVGVDIDPWFPAEGEEAEALSGRVALMLEEKDFLEQFEGSRDAVDAHKGDFGHALLVAGAPGYAGAAALCTTACVQSGAGLVTTLTGSEGVPVVLGHCPSAMVRSMETPGSKDFKATFEQAFAKATAVGIGPGLVHDATPKTLAWMLKRIPDDMPVVLDAEALNAIAALPGELLPLLRERSERHTVLTPHPGEAARLLSAMEGREITVAEVQADRMDAVRRLAIGCNAVVVLKGVSTLISDGITVMLNPTGNPGLAAGGTGDVLTGLIAGLLAQEYPAMFAACAAVFLHGVAADVIDAEAPAPSIAPMTLARMAGTVLGFWLQGLPVDGFDTEE